MRKADSGLSLASCAALDVAISINSTCERTHSQVRLSIVIIGTDHGGKRRRMERSGRR